MATTNPTSTGLDGAGVRRIVRRYQAFISAGVGGSTRISVPRPVVVDSGWSRTSAGYMTFHWLAVRPHRRAHPPGCSVENKRLI